MHIWTLFFLKSVVLYIFFWKIVCYSCMHPIWVPNKKTIYLLLQTRSLRILDSQHGIYCNGFCSVRDIPGFEKKNSDWSYISALLIMFFFAPVWTEIDGHKANPSASFIEVLCALNIGIRQHLWWHGKVIVKKERREVSSGWNCVYTIFKTMKFVETCIGGYRVPFHATAPNHMLHS